MEGILNFFSDPVLRAPTIASMLMGLAGGMIGVVVFLRKESLLGEALSHAAYPGVIAGIVIGAFLRVEEPYLALFGGAITALISIYIINQMEKRLHIRSDSALCFVLASTFGIGVTAASHIQFTHPMEYRRTISFLYGQAATMTDVHIWIYAVLSLVIAGAFYFFYKEIKLFTFDGVYAKSLGIPTRFIGMICFSLVVATVIIGIRTVGVVLMSAMLIAPPVAARQLTQRFSYMILFSGLFGMVAGFLGNMLSVNLTTSIILPTGPMIILSAATISLFALLLAPQRGLLVRGWRIAWFRQKCLCENILKSIWKQSPHAPIPLNEIKATNSAGQLASRLAIRQLQSQGWVDKVNNNLYALTVDGRARAEKIVRLHRLWEVYLADYLGVGAERVHRNAEEMEHIITPALERELTKLLQDPKLDPHHQPIPPHEETM